MKTILCAVAALAFVGSAVADTINVPAGGDIQAAINGASNGDIIQLEAGTYLPAATIDTLGKAVTIRGTQGKDGGPASIIDGQDSIRVLQCLTGEGQDTVFEYLLIRNGFDTHGGGGMGNSHTSPTLIQCWFEGNNGGDGAGMLNIKSSPTLIGCEFYSNFATGNGGGMYNSVSSPTLIGCQFFVNGTYGNGGGMWNEYSNPTLTNCSFEDHVGGDRGGGMYNTESSPELSGCTFTGNSANSGSGGGMRNTNNSSPTLTGCTFTGNSADFDGGGMDNSESCEPTLTGCTLAGNTPKQISGGNCTIISEPCVPGDLDGDGDVDSDDYEALGVILNICQGDINGDGVVDGADLGLLIGAWGPCR